MIKFQEIKVGDYVYAENEGTSREGVVTQLNNDDKQVCVDNGIQEFWYETDQLAPIPITDGQLKRLKFESEMLENGTMKYMKGAFRMLVPKENDFSRMEIWYREEARHITQPIHLHQLQNHFYEMTKVHLDDTDFR